MKAFCTKFVVLILVIATVTSLFASPLAACADETSVADVYEQLQNVRDELVGWKKTTLGIAVDEDMLDTEMLSLVGSTAGDWYPFGLARGGYTDNFDGYLACVNDYVSKRYQTKQKLHAAKATEWHRIALAVLACGGDPTRAGNDGNIDLIADGTYNRTDGTKGILGKQGINGYIWGLIALDSYGYAVAENAAYDRKDIIATLLSLQLADGGWALAGNTADPDITSMTVTALAPYYNSEDEYVYANKNLSDKPLSRTVRDCVDDAVACLSAMQLDGGDYFGWGSANCESTVWVAVALASLGRDVTTDVDFVKNGNTLIDGIMKYRNTDGGFIHSYKYDSANPSAKTDESNTMTGEQTLYGITALLRLYEGKRRLFDLREEFTEEQRQQINDVKAAIDMLDQDSDVTGITDTYAKFRDIPSLDRSYVTNYAKLSTLLRAKGVEIEHERTEYVTEEKPKTMYEFTDVDKQSTDELPSTLTLYYYPEVVRLLNKINNSFDFDEKNVYQAKLQLAKKRLDDIQAEVTALSEEIKQKLYPFDITLAEKQTVYALYDRYSALSEYDKTLIDQTDAEQLVKAKTQVDNLTTAVYVFVGVAVVALFVAVGVVLHVRSRIKKRAANKMPESEE